MNLFRLFNRLVAAGAAAVFCALLLITPSHADPDLTGASPPGNAIWLDSLPLTTLTVGWGTPEPGKSIAGAPIKLGGTTYTHGVGAHADSDFFIDLNGGATRFQSEVGIDDEVGLQGAVTFSVIVDGVNKLTTSTLHGGDAPLFVDVDLTGAKTLDLKISGGGAIAYDHADWAGAIIALVPGAAVPTPLKAQVVPGRLTILPESPLPAIHYPQITGATPGRWFLFIIPATGKAPLTYSAAGLPAGLTLNPHTGIITGSLKSAGRTKVAVTVKNSLGADHSLLTIVAGDHVLAQTPPMGWNSWNVWAGNVDENKVKAAADVITSTGLTQHGYEYVNIDDTWEAGRDANGKILSNSKFPDMKALTDYIHARGLKAGIYSSPGPTTCGGYTASYLHEAQDAATYAKWGFDYLKYDWCSYGGIAPPNPTLADFQKPYAVMRTALDATNRDIIYSLCQYGMGDVWNWGADPEIKANSWRTHNDIDDQWLESMSWNGRGLYTIIESMIGLSSHAGPGHWNDPDMLMVGYVGFGNPHPSRLTPNEQITHISMWCMFSSPLLIGCDLTRLDPFTRALLTNDEAIAINQDQLGIPAQLYTTTPGGGEIWVRPLSDGSKAVALFNPSDAPLSMTVTWAELGLAGNQKVRDLWLHQTLGSYNGSYAVDVPTHGTVLLKITPT